MFLIGWMYQVAKLTRDVAEVEGQLDRAQRDRSALTNQLEEARCKLSCQEQEKNKVLFALRTLDRANLHIHI